MLPIVNGLAAEYGEAVRVETLNVGAGYEENAALQASLGLRGHPTTVVIDEEGAAVAQFFGVVSEAELAAAVDSMLRR